MDALGYRITYTYDTRGNVLGKTDAKGNKTSYDYNKSGNLTKVTDSGVNGGIDTGNVTKYSYDKLGNIIEQTRVGKSSDKDQKTTYEYDKNGNLTKLTDPTGESITYTYDADGKLTKEVQKDGTTTKYTYDKVGNEKKITYSDNRSVIYTYTSTDQVKTMTDWNGTTTYEYDANGQVTEVTDGNNQTIEYTWTKLGQKKSIKYPTNDSVSYNYDNNGNLTKVTDTNSGITNYTYDALNQVKTKNLPNRAGSTYTYDKNGWLTQREETSSGASKQIYTYEYDKNGNRTKETKVSSGTTETTRYTYDVLNQLTSVVDKNGTRNYAFDEFNNRTVKEEIGKETTKYTYNNLNQLVETVQGATVSTYDYDKRGNVVEVEENGDTKQTYVFDSTNKMSKVVTYKDNTSGSGTSETVTTKYAYDGAGNRVNTKVELNGSVTSNTTYVVDRESSYNDIIMAKDSVSGKTSIFTFSDEVISVETSGNISYYRTDEKNSVTDILDTTGKVKATIEYDEYGVTSNPEVVSTGGNIFAYTGHVYEESTGLYYAKARYYDAEIGRFVSEDSYRGEASDPASLNLYGYVKNNPIIHSDPSGNVSVVAGAGAAITAKTLIEVIIAGVTIIVSIGYFFSKEGQEEFKNAVKVVCDGVKYTVKKFKKKFEQQFTAQLEWEVNIKAPNINLSDVVKEKSPKPKTGNSEAGSIERELGEIASGYPNLKCKEAAAAMASYLKKNNKKYKVIKITFTGGPGFVYSNIYDKQISENGVHVGIVYNKIAYCNVHPYGLPVKVWVNDFEAVGKRTVTPPEYNY